ncbi:response regulator transcription factor [Sphingomonas sp.]|uniref:response regulator transcription factor n=1 Tax=Sphingomonas sp. TaxID=28214 RepID=UPI003D6C7378
MQLTSVADRQQWPLIMATKSVLPDDTPTVFVVDDDEFVREALETLIEVAGWRARTFESADLFLACPPATGANCLVLDVNLPGLNGLDLQMAIAGERGDMPIIFITGFGDIPMSVRAMKAGAVEFLTKPFGEQVMLDAISAALERSRAAVGDQAALQALRNCYADLSPRERQVMAGVVSGRMNKQVGGDLGITEITVKKHRGRVMEKMHARSLAELVNMSASLGLSSSVKG